MRLKKPTKVSKKVTCIGGPWAGQEVWMPVQDSGDPLSLPITVKSWSDEAGRYNMNTGQWIPMEVSLTVKKKELLK